MKTCLGGRGRARTGDHDVVNIFGLSPLGQILMNAVDVFDVEEASLGTPENTREVLNGIAFGWCVDNAEHLIHVVV